MIENYDSVYLVNEGQWDLSDVQREKWGRIWIKTSYVFNIRPLRPLTLVCGNMMFQPDRHFRSDGGSIPIPLQGLPGYGPFDSDHYFFHDSGYTFHGLYVRVADTEQYVYCPLSRWEMDRLLRLGRINDGLRLTAAWAIWWAVRMGGAKRWNAGAPPKGAHAA